MIVYPFDTAAPRLTAGRRFHDSLAPPLVCFSPPGGGLPCRPASWYVASDVIREERKPTICDLIKNKERIQPETDDYALFKCFLGATNPFTRLWGLSKCRWDGIRANPRMPSTQASGREKPTEKRWKRGGFSLTLRPKKNSIILYGFGPCEHIFSGRKIL